MDLREATGVLLHAPDVGNWIKLADNYIQTRNKMPESFVLPANHAVLKPIIEAFASDAEAFSDYIRALRDSSGGVVYDELHNIYRTISTRTLQVVRRTRLRKAVTTLLPHLEKRAGRAVNYREQMHICDLLEKEWGAMRLNLMRRERDALERKRLPTEERAAVLDAFWTDIDKKIEKGEVPLGSLTWSDLDRTLRG